MKRSLLVVCLAAILGFVSTPSFAQAVHPHGGKTNFPVTTSLVVGSTTLQPGEYKIQCVTVDGKEYLVVTSSNNKEVARVQCKSQSLEQKVVESSVLTSTGTDGAKKLVGLRIKGETSSHVVAE